MCTVTYLPKPESGFILTHNRDEHYLRGVASMPEIKTIHNTSVATPVDTQAAGTWVATSGEYTLCLLNGGFIKHKHNPPYRHSRGKIILDFFEYKNVEAFVNGYDLQNIEPFTLIIIKHNRREINQLVYDEIRLHHTVLDNNAAHIWSSATLYTEDDRVRRKKYFEHFLQHNTYTQEEIIRFHTNKYEQYTDEGILINREDVLKTVSLTSIHKSASVLMYYEDFILDRSVSLSLF